MRVRFYPIGLLMVAGLVGCMVGPNYEKPNPKMPGHYSEPTTQPTTQPVDLSVWWKTFNDPELSSLIHRADQTNLDLLSAIERIRQARAQYIVTAGSEFPTVNATGSYTTTHEPGAAVGFPGAPIKFNLWQAGLDASWEVDIFGGERRDIEAAGANVQASIEDSRDVRITLLSEVAIDYVQLRGVQRDLRIIEQNVQYQQQTLDLTKSKFQAGLATNLDVSRAEALVETTQAEVPPLDAQIHQFIHALSVLLGLDPGALWTELAPPTEIPTGPAAVPAGLPSELLRRRPDIRRAERQLAAATATIGVATAELFPQFSLTGTGGIESPHLSQIANWNNRFYNAGPSVSWQILNAGQLLANVDVQNAVQRQALLTYQKTVLTSMQEVEDALVNFSREQARREFLAAAVVSNQKAVDLATDLYSKGLTDFLNVLDAERDLLSAQDQLTKSEAQVSADLVSLYKALGGGWD